MLWLYQGRGDGTFTTRVRVGGGWGAYTHLVGIGDGNRDGRADLRASAPDGASYFYQGTGNALWPTSPYNHASCGRGARAARPGALPAHAPAGRLRQVVRGGASRKRCREAVMAVTKSSRVRSGTRSRDR